jgi:ABC-2 type transport system ATP-binding protein
MNLRAGLAIEARALAKAFGSTRAVDSVDLSVPTGSIYGLLGPNGAGKTTVIRMLATLTRPDAGRALVLGFDVVAEPAAIRARVSLTGQFTSLDDDLTGWENLVLVGRLLGHRPPRAKARADELLCAFDLSDASNRQVSTYSGGMRRRLDIAASLVLTPDLMFLDEPTTGLDPRSRGQVWQIVRDLAAGGCTVLLTTQYLEEADQLADRIAVIDHGAVVAEGTPTQLKGSVGSGVLRLRLADPTQRPAALQVLRSHASGEPGGDPAALSTRVASPVHATDLLAALAQAGVELADFALDRPSLDEAFLALTGHPGLIKQAAS